MNAFSVIVPVFNKENEIIRTLESIEVSIQFFYKNHVGDRVDAEVIIVNDGSTDRTVEKVTAFIQDKPHCTLVHHFKSQGAGATRNTGAKASKGDILFFCDGDDLYFEEHLYFCYAILSHQPSEPGSKSFSFTTQRGAYTVELPNYAIGVVRTGVYMQDPLQPYWKAAIENTLPLNLAIRRECHEFIEGFPEALAYKKIGCEDISYTLWASRCFRVFKATIETVEYIRYPGNAFDRQLKKFQTPPEEYQEELSSADRELHTVRRTIEQERTNYLLNKLKRVELFDPVLSVLNWQQLTNDYLVQQDHHSAIAIAERAIAQEPEAKSSLKNLLAVAYNNLGSALHQQKNLPQATEYFQKAIELNPDFSATDRARIYYNVATVLKEQEKFAQAVVSLEKALALDAQLPEAIAALPGVRYQAETQAKGYEFTQDWFSHNTPIWQQYLSQLIDLAGLRALEIGSWEGRSTCWLIDHILTHASARITCVDTFEGGVEHSTYNQTQINSIEARFDRNTARTGSPEKVRKLVGKSQEVLRSLIPNSFHLVYIDGSHIASDVLEDTILTWRLVQVGGIIIFDDYGYSFPQDVSETPPKAAIDAFVTLFDRKVNTLHQGYQLILKKIAE